MLTLMRRSLVRLLLRPPLLLRLDLALPYLQGSRPLNAYRGTTRKIERKVSRLATARILVIRVVLGNGLQV